MHRFPLTVFVFSAFAVAVLAARVAADEEDGMVRKAFDVSVLTTPVAPGSGPILGALLDPDRQMAGQFEEEREPRAFLGGDELVDLLRMWVDPDAWEENGTWIEFRGSRLVVRNRPDVVRGVEAVLYRLAAAARERVLLQVEMLDDGEAGGCRVAGSAELRAGVPEAIVVTGRVDYVAEYEVEIAQASNIGNPIQDHLDEGLVVEAVAHPLLDGKRVLLDAYLQFCCLEEMRTVEVGLDEECFNQPFRSSKRFSNGRVQLPACSHADLHLALLVPTGEDVLVPLVSGARRATLRLHVETLDPAPPGRLLGVSALTARPLAIRAGEPPESLEWAGYLRSIRLHRSGEEGLRPLGGADDVVELLHLGVATTRWEEGDEQLHTTSPDRLVVTARPDLVEQVRTFLRAREAEVLRPVVLDVAVLSVRDTVVPGPGRELDPELTTVVASARLPTLSGRWASLRLGTTRNYLADYDVEVAQEARIPDPIVGQTFGGLAGNLRPHLPLGGRTVRVDLDLLHSLDELVPEAFDTGAQYLAPIEQVRARRTRIDASIGVPLGGRTLVDAGPDPRNPGARLVVSISAKTP